MAELISMTYEQARAEHFKSLKDEAKRKMNYWAVRVRHSRPNDLNDPAHIKASEYGMRYNFYKDALEVLENQPKWISVEERYPADDQCVMYVDDGEIAFRIVRGWALRELCEFPEHREVHRITHWMPLPPSPKEEP